MIVCYDDRVMYQSENDTDFRRIAVAYINKSMPGKYIVQNFAFNLGELSRIFNISEQDQIIMKLKYGT